MRKFFNIILVIVIIIGSELFRKVTGIPVTIMDLILFPLTVMLVYITILAIFSDEKPKDSEIMLSKLQMATFSLIFLFVSPLSFWLSIEGFKDPLQLFTGVKGHAHGYTVAYLGAFVGIFCLFLSYKMARLFISKK
ncbi:hypothetical protein [uncultured Desulfobacter sp.]|uniref:hypothetical protein n=1 Tax=uncultured Desulfobacter sp. TaxID=240139 RepID=UPI0029F469C5|nr:hypothetical protein [uncultured Desulfobacter sp.]